LRCPRAKEVRRGKCPLPENQRGSKINDEPLALAAGATNHDPLVFRLLFFGQDRITVFGGSRNNALLAGAANAEFAGVVDVNTLIEQHFEDRPAFRHEKFPTRAREFDNETALAGWLL